MNFATQFLAHILPGEGNGYYCATTIEPNGGKRGNAFFSDVRSLSDHIIENDRREQTTYHACASFRENRQNPRGTPPGQKRLGRTHANVQAVRALWLDIDLAPKSKYRDQVEAWQNVLAFCKVASLPAPTFVNSGNGLHCYWTLAEALSHERWLPYARGLKELCRRADLQAGPERTADASSILRTPGTHWRKVETRPVTCSDLTGPYPLELFEGLLHEGQEEDGRERHEGLGDPPPAYLNREKATPLAAGLARVHGGEPRFASKVAEQCAQLRHFQMVEGNVNEPYWFACLGVLAFCDDGAEFAQEWSSGHPTYTEKETEEKLAHAAEVSGATLCSRFEYLNPKGCNGCPHRGQIKSPIVLGYNARTIPSTNSTRGSIEGVFQTSASSQLTLPQLPPDYAWTTSNELVLKTANRQGDVDVLISAHPIYLDRVHTGEIRGEFNYLFRQHIPERGWTDIIVPASDLYSAGGAGVLAKQGTNIHDYSHFLRYVRHAVDAFYREGKIRVKYDQFGWKDENTSFLYGQRLYSEAGTTEVAGSDEIRIRSQWVGPSKRGELNGWTRAANSLFAAGCEAQSLALLASFAAPLMRFQSADEGGAIISLVTRQTGTGKTTALAGASSVWGKKDGLGLTNEDTKISKFLSMGALGNLPVVYDEIESRDPEVIREFVINFTNGRDKMRATRSGEIRHTASTWQTILISASNGSLVDALRSTSASEAPAARILEVPLVVPEGLRHALGDKLKDDLNDNCGHAGDAYLRWLTAPGNLAWTREALDTYTQQVWAATRLKSDHRFWVRTAGAVAVAAVIVRKLGLVEFSVDRIVKWLLERIRSPEKAEEDWAAEAIGAFLNDHFDRTIVMAGPYYPTQAHRTVRPVIEPKRGPLAVRYEVQGQRYLVACSALMDWLVRREISYRELAAQLKFRGVVRGRVKVALAAGTDYASGSVWCLDMDASHRDLRGHVPQESNVVPLKQGVGT